MLFVLGISQAVQMYFSNNVMDQFGLESFVFGGSEAITESVAKK